MTTCLLQYVDFPDCNARYGDNNAWFGPLTTTLMVILTCEVWLFWRALLKVSRDGLLRMYEASGVAYSALLLVVVAISLVSPLGLRHSSWLRVISEGAAIATAPVGLITAIQILRAVRKIVSTTRGILWLSMQKFALYIWPWHFQRPAPCPSLVSSFMASFMMRYLLLLFRRPTLRVTLASSLSLSPLGDQVRGSCFPCATIKGCLR